MGLGAGWHGGVTGVEEYGERAMKQCLIVTSFEQTKRYVFYGTLAGRAVAGRTVDARYYNLLLFLSSMISLPYPICGRYGEAWRKMRGCGGYAEYDGGRGSLRGACQGSVWGGYGIRGYEKYGEEKPYEYDMSTMGGYWEGAVMYI